MRVVGANVQKTRQRGFHANRKNSWQIVSTALLYLLFCALPIHSAYAQPDEAAPYDMVSLESAHFIVKYPQNVERYAHKTIRYAEYAYEILSPRLEAEIDKIVIQLLDREDDAQCYVSTEGLSDYFLIYLWPSQEILYAYRVKWLERQIAYHVARLLIQRTRVDWIHSYNNYLLPTWYLDGLASYYEMPEAPGYLNTHGYASFIMRKAAINQHLTGLDRLIFGHQSWLGKRNSKIFGAPFLHYLISHFGEARLIKWNHENASSFKSINRIARYIFGWEWNTLYHEWQRSLESADNPQIAAQLSPDPNAKMSTEGAQDEELIAPWRNEFPQAVPNANALSFVSETEHTPRAIVKLDLESRETKRIVECNGSCVHRWHPDGQTLYYLYRTQTGRFRSETLYKMTFDSMIAHRVPVPGHIRTFAITKDEIYTVSLLNDTPVMYRYSIDAQDHAEIIYTGKPFSLIEDLQVIAKDRLAASIYDPVKERYDLFVFDVSGKSAISVQLTDDDIIEMYPFPLEDGSIGYITEAEDSYQIRSIPIDGGSGHLLHAQSTAIAQPTCAANHNIYYTSVTAQGLSIHALEPNTQVPEDKAPLETLQIQQPLPDITIEHSDTDWSIFKPDSYYPMFGVSQGEGKYLGIGLDNRDVQGHHIYHAHFAWYFDRKMCDMALTYHWGKYIWHLEGGVGVTQKTTQLDFIDRYLYIPYQQYWAYLSTGRSFHIPMLDIHFSLKALAEFNRTNANLDKILTEFYPEYDPSEDPIDEKRVWTNALIASITLNHSIMMPQTIPGEIGYSLSYEARLETPFFGDLYYSFSNTLDIKAAVAMPWGSGHVTSLNFNYRFAFSESNNRYPLELPTSLGFSFNDTAVFHGIRAGNLISNKHLLYAHAAYTFPLANIENKWSKIPLVFNRIGLGVIGDWGLIGFQDEKIDPEMSIFGIGAEAYIDMMIEYHYPVRLIVGYEHGIGRRSGPALYFWLSWL